ncbi:MAG TPA: hypothetical protein VL283_01440 [Candidatus Baltobacteraceae bacterium]|nr:hypothetical protein [Candidatus Baltobacteraceae bacterium]
MIGTLKTLFDRQRRRAEEDADLVGRLDPSRTVLLEDLIADVKRPERVALLGAAWLDAGRFTSRIAAACTWLDDIPVIGEGKGWPGVPLYFFQAASDEEDVRAHRAMLALEVKDPPDLRSYTAAFAHLPLASQYLHIHSRTSWMFEGRHADASLSLRPLFSTFSTFGNTWVTDGDGIHHPVKGRMVGYRLPDFASLLDLSPPVATDFLARIVVHDLCHAYLPHTPKDAEGFHNVAALDAMDYMRDPPYRSPWEEFIHAECTDPSFFLRAAEEIRDVRKSFLKIPPFAEDILKGYRNWYLHPKALRKRREVWGLSDKPSRGELQERIQKARDDGFRLYLRHMD